MNKLPVLLNSGIESLIEGLTQIESYERNKNLKNIRFAILHIDTAVELIVKEYIKEKTQRIIIEKDHKSLSLPDCIKSLHRAQAEILYVNDILILHEIRNNAQLLGLRTAEDQSLEIIEKVLISLRNFLELKFNCKIGELEEYFEQIGYKKTPVENYLDGAKLAYQNGLLESAFIQYYIVLEFLTKKFLENEMRTVGFNTHRNIMLNLKNYNLISNGEYKDIKKMRFLRNTLTHSPNESIVADIIEEGIKTVISLIDHFQGKINELRINTTVDDSLVDL